MGSESGVNITVRKVMFKTLGGAEKRLVLSKDE